MQILLVNLAEGFEHEKVVKILTEQNVDLARNSLIGH